MVQSLLFVGGLLLLSNTVFGPHRSLHRLILWVSAVFFMFLATGRCPAFLPILQNGYHFGVMLSTVLALYWLLRLLDRQKTIVTTVLYAILLCLLSLVMLLSDALSLIQFLLPALIVTWLLVLFSRLSIQRGLLVFLSILPAVPLNNHIARAIFIFRSSKTTSAITLGDMFQSMGLTVKEILQWREHLWFSHDFLSLFQILWGIFIVAGILLVSTAFMATKASETSQNKRRRFWITFFSMTFALGATGLYSLTRQGEWSVWVGILGVAVCLGLFRKEPELVKKENSTNFIVVLSFFLCSFMINILATLAVGGASPRYFLPPLLLPLFFGWPFLAAKSTSLRNFFDRFWGQAVLLVVFVAVFSWLGGWNTLAKVTSIAELSDHYPEFIECMDRETTARNLKHGLAQYWRAKYITALSKNDLHVVQARHGERQILVMDHIINNLNWYNTEFEFILTGDASENIRMLDTQAIVAHFGEPADRFFCNSQEVLVYNRPTDMGFRQFFKQEFSFAAEASQLPSQMGAIQGTSRIAEEKTDGDGALTYGPYKRLPIGEYRFEIQAFVQKNAAEDTVGRWEIVVYPIMNGEISVDTSTVIKKGKFEKEGEQTITEPFMIWDDKAKVEIRTYYTGKGTLRVDKITLDRIR